MRVLDANFLIDYLSGHPATETYYESNGGEEELWVMPAPAHAEALVGVGNLPSGDLEEAVEALSWGEIYEVSEDLSVEAGRIADEVGSQGPYLDGVDALVAAVGRELDATVVSVDGDLTHEETKQVIDVEEYR
ncbi:PIN domain-containing protein [Haloarcula marismortui]|uniref:PIN domain-containing protein n=1 Tax=Haloarcula marismortui ATCC 33800 TaxID=662476 RepID=M0JKC6_9EURY|nr:PIN domain-containing protein [Haloarcula sinaiiensis]EMA09572.1 PilT domain-containing protein [Haloarcula sinaiiensis ATCC 33800]QUJ74317.1 PIN domain-containing protein [Haloarcula sinaiiensis ATCC 33800]